MPSDTLETFPEEFREGVAARASIPNDDGASATTNWEYLFGSSDSHVLVTFIARIPDDLTKVLDQAQQTCGDLPDIKIIYNMDCSSLPEGRNPFWFKDGLHNPHVEGRGTPIYTGYTSPVRAGEFVMGYPDEQSAIASQPRPDALRLSGTSAAIPSFQTNVASFRTFLRESASGREDEELLAAKLVGR